MNSTPLVSVVIPAFNQAVYLEDSIKSVLSQTYKLYEVIIVDDGSTDNTFEVAKKYFRYPNFCYLYQENRGLAGARNTGIRNAHGELIALLDADDLWLPEYLDTMVTLTEEIPQAAVFYCAAVYMDAKGSPLNQTMGYFPIKPGDLYRFLLRSNFINSSTVTARKSVMSEAGLFDQNFRSCEDWDLWLRLLSAGVKFHGIPAVLSHYRIHGTSLSMNISKMQSSAQKLIEKHFGEDDGLYDQWTVDKRIAYGGLYRYYLLTYIQRQNNWQGVEFLKKAILSDPSLACDISFFYDLAMGSQPFGYRGTSIHLDITGNVSKVENLLDNLFTTTQDTLIQHYRNKIYGNAYKALGLVAYNAGQFLLSRSLLMSAIYHRPGLLMEKLVVGDLIKSILGIRVTSFLRNLHQKLSA